MGNTFNNGIFWFGHHYCRDLVYIHAPPLYDHAHSGHWPSLILRAFTHPHEATWRDRHRNTALHLICRRQPTIDVMLALVRACPIAALFQTVDGMTPLHFACYCGTSADVVRLLIETCPEAVSLRDNRCRTALHCACAGYRTADKHDVILALLEVDPEIAILSDDRGRTPLSLLLDDYIEEIEKSLECWDIQYVWSHRTNYVSNGYLPQDINEESSQNNNNDELDDCWKCLIPILKAGYYGTVSCRRPGNEPFRIVHASVGISTCPPDFVLLALKQSPDQVKQKDNRGNLPLHIAASCRIPPPTARCCSSSSSWDYCDDSHYFVAVDALLLLYPSGARCPGPDGRLPLRMAVESGKTWDRGVKALLEAYPPALDTIDVDIRIYPYVLENVGRDSELTVLFEILRAKPEIVSNAISYS